MKKQITATTAAATTSFDNKKFDLFLNLINDQEFDDKQAELICDCLSRCIAHSTHISALFTAHGCIITFSKYNEALLVPAFESIRLDKETTQSLMDNDLFRWVETSSTENNGTALSIGIKQF